MAARGVGPATVISIGLHLLVVAALWRSPAPVHRGSASALEVILAPAPVARRPRRPVEVRAAPSAPATPAVRPAASGPAGPVPAASAPPADQPPPREAGPPVIAPAGAPGPTPSVEDPFDAWSRQVWAAIDLRRPRALSGATAARVAFSLDRDGRLTGLRLAGSSGAPDFDRAALRAVRGAAPFPAPPPGIEAARRRFEIVIRSAGG
jgi:protein TonB